MIRSITILALSSAFLVISGARARSEDRAAVGLPPAVDRPVDFHKEIVSILSNSCGRCHGNGKHEGGFTLDTREQLLAGGDSGPAAVVGKSAESRLIHLVTSTDQDEVMPKKGPRLTPAQIGLLRGWIDQGLTWEEGFTFKKTPGAPIEPRRVELPPDRPGTEDDHPIDRLLTGYLAAHSVMPGKPVDDQVFIRRVYLDAIGVLPTPEEIHKFVNDRREDKRPMLVKRVLADDRRYAEHWLTFWNDALRNDYRGTGYVDNHRKQISRWLYRALATNMPYDQFVRELVNPGPESAGFVDGILWRGVVNASQSVPVQAAQNISQVFLGINLKCASCHDSFVNDWKLSEAYALANVFSDEPLEIHRCDKPIGEFAETRFLYPQLGSIEAKAPRAERLAQLAAALTNSNNGRFSRTIVNRLWARLMGRGLVEPLDDMDIAAWNPELLDWLAVDFAEHKYDVKRLIELMMTSRAYELPAVGFNEQERDKYVFRGPTVKRMTAEQFVDAVTAVTGASYLTREFKPPKSSSKADEEPPIRAQWIWSDPEAPKGTAGGRIFLRRTLRVPANPISARMVATCDNQFTLWVNGVQILASTDHTKPVTADVTKLLHRGSNLITVEAINWPDPETGTGLQYKGKNPAGFIMFARVRVPGKNPVADFGTDDGWVWAAKKPDDWDSPRSADRKWPNVAALGDATSPAYGAGERLTKALEGAEDRTIVRAALAVSDPLMMVLGRPTREQVVTERPKATTTLQALEMTNGATLSKLIERGAGDWLAQHKDERPRAWLDALFERALGRRPTPTETADALAMVGEPASQQSVEDLMWILIMLPEFQLIE